MVACLECLKNKDFRGRGRPVRDEVMSQVIRGMGA